MAPSNDASDYLVEMDELDIEVCWWLIARTRFGRIAFVADDVPSVRPVNCGVLNRQVVFRTGAHSILGRMTDGAPYDWHSIEGVPYSRHVRATVRPGFELDPIYEAKAWHWMRENSPQGERELFWVVGDSRAVR